MAAARTYAEWIQLFDRFGNGDDTVFDDLNSSEFIMDSDIAQRFSLRADEAYKKRKQIWKDRFYRSGGFLKLTKTDDFAMVIRDGKQNLLPLVKFVTSKGLPEAVRQTLHNDLSSSIAEIRRSLKDNITKSRDRNRNDTEKMLLMVSTLDWVALAPLNNEPAGKESNNTCTPVTGRKIIF